MWLVTNRSLVLSKLSFICLLRGLGKARLHISSLLVLWRNYMNVVAVATHGCRICLCAYEDTL
jgi:hypothetical protein